MADSNAFKPIPKTPLASVLESTRSSVQMSLKQTVMSKIPSQFTDPTSPGFFQKNISYGPASVSSDVTKNTTDLLRDQADEELSAIAAARDNYRNENYGNEGRSVPKPSVISAQPEDANERTETEGSFGYKVRLFAVRGFPSEKVIFEVSPTLSENRSVEYSPVSPVHMPGSIQVYKRTGSRSFSLGAKFISRTPGQAYVNMQNLSILRGWTMPYFGLRSHYDIATTTADARYNAASKVKDATSLLGAPPDVLYLYAYSDNRNSDADRSTPYQTNIKKIPVVITSLSFDYPEDVDYILTLNPKTKEYGDPFPVKMDVKIDLAETHSPKGYEEFSLSMFKQGRLVQF